MRRRLTERLAGSLGIEGGMRDDFYDPETTEDAVIRGRIVAGLREVLGPGWDADSVYDAYKYNLQQWLDMARCMR